MISKVAILRLFFCVLASLSQALAAPVITSFTPTAGAPGDQIMLTGSGFLSGSFTVTFWNGVVVTSGYINSDTLMTVKVPAGITTGPIGIQQDPGSTLYTADNFLAVGYGPYIMDFSPAFGSVNDTVEITGVHLTNTTAVKFGGVSATQFTPNAAGTQITTRVPSGAKSGSITVSTTYGTSNSPSAFNVIGSGPFITGFSPISGDTSTKVQITGVHFTGVTNVTFNGRSGTGLIANSDTLVQVQPPSHVLTGPIALYTTTGSFVTSSNFFGSPAIASFTPTTGRVNTNVVINGTNLLGASAVYFGSVASTTFSNDSNSRITAQVPAGASTGLIRVVVPAGSAFSGTNFVVAPTISGFSPGFGPVGTTVTITGANLNASSPTVRFSGVVAATPTTITSTQLVVKVPNGASTGLISVTTKDGTDTNVNRFFLPATVSKFTTTNSPVGSTVSIQGTNFFGASVVRFNGVDATSFAVTNNGSIGAVVPNNVITGPISVTTPAGVASSSGIFYGPPLIEDFSPTHGLPGDQVTVHGINLLGGSVKFSGISAPIVSLNNTQLVATVPAGATTGPITVVGPAGTSTSTGRFTLDYTSDLSAGITNSSQFILVGSNLVYTLSFYNDGPDGAPNATFTNTLPTGVTLVGVSSSFPWLLATNGNVLSGSTTNFALGNSTSVSVTVRPRAAGTITSTVVFSSDNPDPAPADNASSVATIVEPARLAVGVLAGEVTISWPIALTNSVLEFRDSLTGDSQWSAETNRSSSVGGLHIVTETNSASARFYRLRQ